ncbi:Nitrilotriacetate monooxygenase component B [hydrothermal vent metagenome]|uniref:Nitrilotriacetate monooxygenase component B n=1 Tax=hydrothermal vent metagenome TaxID=652676 RepID=A0A3B0RCJ0_9ZZZZ
MNLPDKGQEFRSALGSFATGVTVVTSADKDGAPVGVTASSFNSVSLDPPLVLWSLAKSSLSSETFCSSGHFAIHVLSASQEELSNSFAKSGADKFAEVNWSPGTLGSPLMDDYAALFQCKTLHQYEGGDHVILVGEVVEFDQKDQAPLLFHGGRYAESRPKIVGEPQNNMDITEGRFTEGFLLYMVSRAHFQTSRPTRKKLELLGLSQSEYMALSVLSMNAPASLEEISERLDHTGLAPDRTELDNMVERDLLLEVEGKFELASKGRESLIETLSVAKAFEDDLMDHFTASEIADAKHVLKKLIQLTGNDIPGLWD